MIEGSEFDYPQGQAQFVLPKAPTQVLAGPFNSYSLVPWHAFGLTEHSSIAEKMPVHLLSLFLSFFLLFIYLRTVPFSFRQTVIYTTVFRFPRSVIPFPSCSSFPLMLTASISPPLYLCSSPCSSRTVQPLAPMPFILEVLLSTLIPRIGCIDIVCRI
jgi:hypothetical protein